MRENNPSVRDGWYVPTGGNFFYGIQSGVSFGRNDLHVSVGKSVTQDFKTTPAPPLYFQIGYNRRFCALPPYRCVAFYFAAGDYSCVCKYSEGARPVTFLKYRIKDDFERL